MTGHHFISYSRAAGEDFALRLHDALSGGSSPVPVWLDQRELKPGLAWDDQLVEAIRSCTSLLFIVTIDSVESLSGCKDEWTRALKYKKPIIPILLHADAEMPFGLVRHSISTSRGHLRLPLLGYAITCSGFRRRQAFCKQ